MRQNEINFEHLGQTVHDLYEGRVTACDQSAKIKAIVASIELYEKMYFFDNRLVLLYDHKNAKLLYLSKNVKKILGYTAEAVKKMESKIFAKLFHDTHFNFSFRRTKINTKLYPSFSIKSMLNQRIYIGGLKFLHKNGEVLRGFFRVTPLLVKDVPELSLITADDLSHLFKGDRYWVRIVTDNFSYCYVNHQGKKEYKDLISPREQAILQLIAKNKSTQEIADLLHLSTGTIDTHRKNMIARSGAVNTTALVHLCHLANII